MGAIRKTACCWLPFQRNSRAKHCGPEKQPFLLPGIRFFGEISPILHYPRLWSSPLHKSMTNSLSRAASAGKLSGSARIWETPAFVQEEVLLNKRSNSPDPFTYLGPRTSMQKHRAQSSRVFTRDERGPCRTSPTTELRRRADADESGM